MNIEGRDTNLKLMRSQPQPAIGVRSSFWYTASESCEVINYRALIAVTRGSARRVINAQGLCGT